MAQEGTLVLRWWMWWYSMPLVKGRSSSGTQRQVLPSSAAFTEFHLALRWRQGRLTECCRWNRMLPITLAQYIESHIFSAGTPSSGKRSEQETTERVFSRKVRLKTPYLLATLQKRATNQARGTVIKKNITGSRLILTSAFLAPFIWSYCCLVKRMVWERSRRSRFPKCLWWQLWPSRQALKGKCVQMPISFPVQVFAAMLEKKEKCAISWNCMKRRRLTSVCTVHPTAPSPSWIRTIATAYRAREIPRAIAAFRSSGFPQLATNLRMLVTSAFYCSADITIFISYKPINISFMQQTTCEKFATCHFHHLMALYSGMSHYNRRQAVLPPHPKPDPLDRSLPFKNNEARLKLIYEGQQLFKERPREPSFKKQPNRAAPAAPVRRSEDPQTDIKYRSNIHHLQLREVKVSNRYKEQERDQRAESFHLPPGSDTERLRPRPAKDGPLTTRNREEAGSGERGELFKIKRKSISGSLRKKLKEAQVHHLSSVNPTAAVELNYFEEGKRAYKEGKAGEALRLFELAVERSPDLPDGYYHCALCHLARRNYQRSYDLLLLLAQNFPAFHRKTVPLFTAIAANHLALPEKAYAALTAGISRHPDFLDLYVYRAKVAEAQGRLEEAQEDYEFVLKTKKDSAEVLLGYALLLRRKGLTANALSALGSALSSDKGELRGKILLARVRMNFQLGRVEECRKDLSRLGEAEAEGSEGQFFRGLLLLADRGKKQALLAFEKCIRANDHPASVAGALVEITKSKIEDRDFYSALYHINRAGFLQLSTPEIEKFRLFTEGVVFMMKRKINEGVENLYRLAEQHAPIGTYFDRLYYLYRAFGHFMQNRHQLAIDDYAAAEQFTPQDKHVRYNRLIAEGIVAIHRADYEPALAAFDQAQATISAGCPAPKIEPFIYRAMTFIEKVRAAQGRGQDELETLEELFRALKELDKAYDVNDSNSNMLYLRSLIYMYLGKCEDGLQDIIKAISKSEENVAKYFFYRALAHQTLGNKKQALNDFNICINLDEKYANAYLERAKLLFSTEQAAKGLEDLRRLRELDPSADTKLHEFCLYYLYKEYDLAELCLQEMQANKRRDELEVLLDLKQLRITNARDKMASAADKMICEVILGHWSVEEAPADDLHFFTHVEYYSYLGIRAFHLAQYEEAINNFTLALKEKSLQDLEESAGGELEAEEEEGEEEEGEPALQAETKAEELHYLNYNLFLSYLANQERKKAYETFIRDVLPAKEAFLRSEPVSALSKALFQAMRTSTDEVVAQEGVLEVVLFRSLFGESVDCIEIALPSCTLRTKLCYLMPFSRQIEREYSPRLNPDFILACLRISEVENRPEPPWVRRNNQDLVFTDEVIDINVEFQTTEHDEEAEEEEYEGEEGEGTEQEEEEESREEAAFDPRRFRDQMRLDDDIERKLQKIMQKKKKTE